MLSLSNLKAKQAETYYQADDYYTNEKSNLSGFRPQWSGKGAAALNLSGEIKAADFKGLLNGYAPDGKPLFQRQVDSNKRRGGTDYTLSAPKSVSIAALVQQDERVLAAHHYAVRVALSVIESRYVESRITVSPGNRQRVFTGNIISAMFTHQTSREFDPQLHTHCVTINATQAPDGRWFSFSNENVIRNQKLLGEIYQNELAHQLQQSGYQIEPTIDGQFELKGYNEELLQSFSQRRQQIKALMEKWSTEHDPLVDGSGKPIKNTAARREAANLRSRKNKCHDIAREDLIKAWQQHIEAEGFTLPTLPDASNKFPAQSTAPEIIHKGIEHCEERRTVFNREKIERFALEHHLGQQPFNQLETALNESTELIRVEPRQEQASSCTTKAAVQLELNTIRTMHQGKGQVLPLAHSRQIQTATADKTLTAGQLSAIHLSATSKDQIIAWQGVAGAGKTYALAITKTLAEQSGYQAKGYAPSAEAANVLGESLQIETATVAHLLNTEKARLGPQLWIVDEASLLG
ncbi:MAG: MobF family relaxase, partial [Cyanobacteria bacterium P01_D01_bin.156]